MSIAPWGKKGNENESESPAVEPREENENKGEMLDIEAQKEAIKRLLQDKIKDAFDEELRKATEELMKEQRTAIKEMVEEQRRLIKETVEDEKKAIWEKVEEIRQSISTIGIK